MTGRIIGSAAAAAALLFSFALTALPRDGVAADVVYVQSRKARLMDAPSFGAKAVGEAKKGDALSVLEKKQKWYRVSHAGASGWVPEMAVGPKPPMKPVSVFTGEEEDIEKESRRRASQVTTAAAARGLTDEDRRRLGHKGIADYRSLEKIEAVAVTEAELSEFQGGLR